MNISRNNRMKMKQDNWRPNVQKVLVTVRSYDCRSERKLQHHFVKPHHFTDREIRALRGKKYIAWLNHIASLWSLVTKNQGLLAQRTVNPPPLHRAGV